ncbi:MAG: serine/threonine-protein kinase [Pirellulaceae bacterium]|nr:serine/threonine-protein kinase [Pirellulaceae bacterium]
MELPIDDKRQLLDAPTQINGNTSQEAWSETDDSLPEISGYQIIRELGRGGMGVVYLAKQLSLDRMVALKTIQPRSDEGFAKLLMSEAQIVGSLDHPAIVPIYEANTSGEVWYFSMGLVKGDDLAHRLAKGVLNAEQVVRLASELCDALDHAHQQNVLHLDIKPANILLDAFGNPKLTDFGLSAMHASEFADKRVVGTPQFMSPEQVLSSLGEISPASDIYSLGAVMYATLVGRPPIVSANSEDLLLRVISQPPTSLRQFGLRIPRPLEAIVNKCLQKKPQQRYQSARELKEDLQAFASGQPVKAKPPSIWSSFEYQLRRHILAASVSGSAALLLLLLVAVVLVRTWTQSTQIFELESENDRLKKVVALQRELTQGRLEQKDVAVKLDENGDLDRAAFFAAEAIQQNPSIASEDQQKLLSIVQKYAERHPAKAGVTESTAELVARVVAEGELRQAAALADEDSDTKDADAASHRLPPS